MLQKIPNEPFQPRYMLCMLSCVELFDSPWTIALQASLSMGFPRREYWSGLFFASPVDLPNPGIKPPSPALAEGFFTADPSGKPQITEDPS